MNYTPAQPTFEQMRDGILQAVTDSTHACLVWDAFADFGVGVGAKGVGQGSKAVITPSETLPSECVAVPYAEGQPHDGCPSPLSGIPSTLARHPSLPPWCDLP